MKDFEYREIGFYGKYWRRLGAGALGIVSLYKRGEEMFAIKWQRYDSEAITEIAVLKALNHPNIIKIIDIVSDGKKIGIVMKYAEYGTSIASVKECKNKVKLVYQLLCGISYMHSQDIEHRDLKPQNLLVFDECILKIADFGAADALRCSRPGKTLVSPVGTLWYRPPELLFGSNLHVLASDMWSVGCIIFELLKGHPFVTGDDEMHLLRTISEKLGTVTTTEWPKVDLLPKYNYYTEFRTHTRQDNLFDDLGEWKEILNDLLVYNPEGRKTAYEILLNPIFDSVRDKDLEYPLRGCIENLNFRRPKFPKNGYTIDEKDFRTVEDWMAEITDHSDSTVEELSYAWQLLSLISTKNGYTIDEKDFRTVEDWMTEITDHSDSTVEELSYAWQLLSLISTKKKLHRGNLQAIAGTCVWIASEIRGDLPIERSQIASETSSDKKTINSMRNEILTTLQFNIILSCPVDYIKLYGSLYPPEVQKLALFITLLLITLDKKDRRDPERLGFICIVLACMHYDKKVLHSNLITKKQLSVMGKILEKPEILKEIAYTMKRFETETDMNAVKFIQNVMKKDIIV